MSLLPELGPPQIAALVLLAQRAGEEAYAQYNTRRLLAEGALEKGRSYYPVVAVTHLGWIAALAFLIAPDAPLSWPLLGLYGLLQIARYWVIGTLGRYWTHRIITLPSAPLVRRGIYRHVRHPNYVVTLTETALLPAVFSAYALAAIMTAIWGAVLYYKIILEDAALEGRPVEQKSAQQP